MRSQHVVVCFRLLGLAALQFRPFLFGHLAKSGSPVLRTGILSRLTTHRRRRRQRLTAATRPRPVIRPFRPFNLS